MCIIHFSLDGRYMILYEEVDESEVDLIKFPTSLTGDVEEFRFPKVGSTNAHSVLKMASFRLGLRGEVTCIEPLELRFPLEAVFSWLEYLVRAGWTPDGKL
jgi:dipeptidyl-peptidase 9